MIRGRPFIQEHRLLEDEIIHLRGDMYSFKYDTRQGMLYHAKHTTMESQDPITAEIMRTPCVINQAPHSLFNIRHNEYGGREVPMYTYIEPGLMTAAASTSTHQPSKPRKVAKRDTLWPKPLVCVEMVQRLREIAEREMEETLQSIAKGIKEKELLRAAQLDELATPPGPSDMVAAPL